MGTLHVHLCYVERSPRFDQMKKKQQSTLSLEHRIKDTKVKMSLILKELKPMYLCGLHALGGYLLYQS